MKEITEVDIKNRRKEAIRNEHFIFRLLILLGAVRYKVSYDKFHGYRKTYKIRSWHPITWVFIGLCFIFSIPKAIWEAFKDIRDEFKEKTYYC